MELRNPKFDVIFAPYETYLDDLLGVKTSYGAAVLVRHEAESANLQKFQQWVPDIQEALPLPASDLPSVRGHVTPMEVMDAPFRAGDLRHGYQAVADNLPNDPRIHREKGAKHIFFKNFMDARVREVIAEVLGKRKFDFALERALFAMVANRACAPSSKLYCYEQWLGEDVRINGTETLQLHHLYRAMDFLEENKDAVEEAIYYRKIGRAHV